MIMDGSHVQDDSDVFVAIRGVVPHVFIHANDTHAFTPSWIIDQQARPFDQGSSVGCSSRRRRGPGDARHARAWRADRLLGSYPDATCERTPGPVAAHAHVQNRGTPPAGLVRQEPDHRVMANALAPAALAPPILSNNAACQHCMVWLNALAGHFQAKVIQARERAQVGAIKGSIGHVEVFRMDGVGISIIERPRPLPGHDTPNSAQYPYTPKCEEPVWVACHWGRNACVKGVTRAPAERLWTWKRP